MADGRPDRCFFCGATFPDRELHRGSGGAICRACVAALHASAETAQRARGARAMEQATRTVSADEVKRLHLGADPSSSTPEPIEDLGARVGDSTAFLDTMEGTEDDEIDLDRAVSREPSAHDYESRMDLAAAYMEMGRRHAAVRELLAALESALLCRDYLMALRCVSRVRAAVNVPKVRDRICEILARHAKEE